MTDSEILHEAQRVLREQFVPDCEDFDPDCAACRAKRALDDIAYLVQFVEP